MIDYEAADLDRGLRNLQASEPLESNSIKYREILKLTKEASLYLNGNAPKGNFFSGLEHFRDKSVATSRAKLVSGYAAKRITPQILGSIYKELGFKEHG